MYSNDVLTGITQHINQNDQKADFKKWSVAFTPLNEEEFKNANSEIGTLFKRIDSINEDQHGELQAVLKQASLAVNTEDNYSNVIVYKPL